MPNGTGCALFFWRLWVLRRHKLRLRSPPPLKPRGSRSRFRYRNAQKRPTRNIAGKKRVGLEVLDFDYLFANFLQRNQAYVLV